MERIYKIPEDIIVKIKTSEVAKIQTPTQKTEEVNGQNKSTTQKV